MAKSKVRKTTKQLKRANIKSKNEGLYVIIAILVIVVVGLSVAYAALSTSLNITVNKVTQNKLDWVVGFKNETVTGNTLMLATDGTGATSTNGLECGSATSAGASVTVSDTQLSKPGDNCYWKLTVLNTGDIDAILTSINASAPTSISCTGTGASSTMVCGNITYKLTTDYKGTTPFAISTRIGKTNGTNIVYLHAIYTGTDVGSGSSQSGAKFTLLYEQA